MYKVYKSITLKKSINNQMIEQQISIGKPIIETCDLDYLGKAINKLNFNTILKYEQ